MRRPRALDLFCCAGGASMGLHQAGFDVIGVDRTYHANYPFRILVADALDTGLDLASFDLIWASPPCQRFSQATPVHARERYPDLIEPVRGMLAASGARYVIENVPGAPLRRDVVLTGDMFGLGTFRRRWFEVNFPVLAPKPGPRFGPETVPDSVTVAGGGGKGAGDVAAWSAAMGIDWMNRRELAQAVPPAYARFLAEWALRSIDGARANPCAGAELANPPQAGDQARNWAAATPAEIRPGREPGALRRLFGRVFG